MELFVYYKSIIKSPNGRFIIPSEPILGVKRFFTTNGRVLFNDADACFYIYEPNTMIIRIHSESWQASCLSKSQSEDFEVIRQELLKLYPGGGVHQVLVSLYSDADKDEDDKTSSGQALTDVVWEAGLGAASEGVFPNADSQFVNKQHS